MLLLIDNFDSFAHNLARYFERLGQEVRVVRNNALSVADCIAWQPEAIILSPGPCTPREAGICLEIVEQLHGSIPLLGVCLGHQTIAAALGGRIVRAAEPMHGRTSQITHANQGMFAKLPSPIEVCRYHSLIVQEDSLPSELEVTARSDDGTIMAVGHRSLPVFGVQFHPESILSEHGFRLLAGFLWEAGVEHRAATDLWSAERTIEVPRSATTRPTRPVPF